MEAFGRIMEQMQSLCKINLKASQNQLVIDPQEDSARGANRPFGMELITVGAKTHKEANSYSRGTWFSRKVKEESRGLGPNFNLSWALQALCLGRS